MKSCGVIVEYNPFHLGHEYHIREARKVSQADVIVAVMSGPFLQRGEPSILDKWSRAEVALKHGVDLIIELPYAYAVQSADYFANGGVKLLQALGVDSLCFGTDSSQKLDYSSFGAFHVKEKYRIESAYQAIKDNGQSYGQQMTQVYQQCLPEWPLDMSSPNHILGMSYAKENAQYERPMSLFPIHRQGNHYHDHELTKQGFSSATSIREKILSGKGREVAHTVPQATYNALNQAELSTWEHYWPYLKYVLTVQSTESLSQFAHVHEGIEYRLKEQAGLSDTFQDFMEKVKTKRYTWTRIQRMCVAILMQVTQQEIEAVRETSYLRILGFNDKGRAYLKQQKKQVTLPLITKVSKKESETLSLDVRAGQLYMLGKKDSHSQDFYRSPIYIKEDEK